MSFYNNYPNQYPPVNYGNPIPPPMQSQYPSYPPPSNQYSSYPPPSMNYGAPSTYPTYPSQGPYGGSNSYLRQVFDQWDLNRNGQIDERELGEALRQMGEISDPETVREMIRSYDKDGNGTIDFYEFEDLYNYVQNLKSTFHTAARSPGGSIGFNDAKNMLTSMSGTSLIAAPVLLYSFWKVYERSGQGKVYYRDFILMAFAYKKIMNNYKKKNPQRF